jgi:hypothetical protein
LAIGRKIEGKKIGCRDGQDQNQQRIRESPPSRPRRIIDFVICKDSGTPGELLRLVVRIRQAALRRDAAMAGIAIGRREGNLKSEVFHVGREKPTDMPSSRIDFVVPQIIQKLGRRHTSQ